MSRHVLSVLVENQSGVLSRVSGLFSRRGYNIDSLSVGETEDPKVSRMTIVVKGDYYILEQIQKQLKKLIDVIKIVELDMNKSIYRELALIKVNTSMETRASIIEIVSIFRANIVDVSNETLTVEMTGDESKIDAFINLMEFYGIAEIVRTGLSAIERGNNPIKNRKEFKED